MNQILIEQLKRHEGFSERVYQCTANKTTIGYGYNLNANSLNLSDFEILGFKKNGITERIAEWLLKRQIEAATNSLSENITWFEHLDDVRQCVLINMAFNMGITGLLQFKNTLAMIKAGDYDGASKGMLKSKWALQVKGRANELATQMKNGRFA